MKPRLRHIMIRASAGSGKTYALTNRFIELLAIGAAPERIVALTFTRKAAGEFFEAIIKKLTAAAENEVQAERLATEIGVLGLRTGDFLRLLRILLKEMPRLRLGTLDSFYGGIARAFPFELGLAGNFELLPDFERLREQQRVMGSLFTSAGELTDGQTAILHAFKQATFGTESKRLRPVLEAFLKEHHERFLENDAEALWGAGGSIWGKDPWWEISPPATDFAHERLRQWGQQAGLVARHRARWHGFLDEMAEWRPGVPAGERMGLFIPKILQLRKELPVRGGAIPFERTAYAMSAELGRELVAVMAHIFRGESERLVQVTKGIHQLLWQYDTLYNNLVRRAGRLTFSDVQRLLQPGQQAHQLSSAEGRELLGFRLDATVDHWLLDEFQDTSRGQWDILHTLVGEVLQDPVGERSFFCVGDIKQSIYGWRGGDRRLFGEIISLYNRAEPAVITQQELAQSRRSGPSIIATVNKVFGASAIIAGCFSEILATQWNASWLEHTTALPDRTGHAVWLHAAKNNAAAIIVRLLGAIHPLERGLSCCILTRKNKEAVRLAAELRQLAQLPAVAETDAALAADTPYISALLATLRAAYHPGDRYARGHVAMTPLGDLLAAEKLSTPEALALRFTSQISEGGFEAWAHYWLQRAETTLAPDDQFSRRRGQQFLAAARQFDLGGSHDPDEFVEYIASYKIRDEESAASIRVMTMHSAKGLDFDIVILPDLEGDTIESMREGLGVERTPEHNPKWVLDLPPRWFSEHDPALSAYIKRSKADAGFEALALLYVAMTRAKRGLYIIAPPPPLKSSSANYLNLLANTLGRDTFPRRIGSAEFVGSWSEGDPEWYEDEFPAPAAGKSDAAPLAIGETNTPGPLRRVARLPSAGNRSSLEARQLFAADAQKSSAQGTLVHTLLAEVEWADAPLLARVELAWRARGLPVGGITAALATFHSPVLGAIWKKPPQWAGEIWRERSFEMILDNTWVSGVFDRVEVTRLSSGEAVSATVIDFKTDRVGPATDDELRQKYIEQMQVYRRVAATLAGLPLRNVSADLVFTTAQRRIIVAGPEG